MLALGHSQLFKHSLPKHRDLKAQIVLSAPSEERGLQGWCSLSISICVAWVSRPPWSSLALGVQTNPLNPESLLRGKCVLKGLWAKNEACCALIFVGYWHFLCAYMGRAYSFLPCILLCMRSLISVYVLDLDRGFVSVFRRTEVGCSQRNCCIHCGMGGLCVPLSKISQMIDICFYQVYFFFPKIDIFIWFPLSYTWSI